MDKYQGIHRPAAEFSTTEQVKTVKKPRNGYLKGLFARVMVAAAMLGAVFAFKFVPLPISEKAAAAVKTAVLFDLNPRGENESYFGDKLDEIFRENK